MLELKSILIKGSKFAIPSEKDVSPMRLGNSLVILEKNGFTVIVVRNSGKRPKIAIFSCHVKVELEI